MSVDLQLKNQIEKLCVRFGAFKLAGGGESNIYFNMKPAMFFPDVSAKLIRSLASRLFHHSTEIDAIGGPEVGAIPLIAGLSTLTGIQGFYVRKAAKTHGVSSLIEGLPFDYDLKGKRVVLVEDVVTSGGSVLKAADQLEAAGATVTLVICCLDRQAGGAAKFAARNIEFASLFKLSDFEVADPFDASAPSRGSVNIEELKHG